MEDTIQLQSSSRSEWEEVREGRAVVPYNMKIQDK